MTTALYRRYRPENFAEVIGQEHVTGPLRQALRSGQVNHAYLFSGPRGCGKTSSARILARILNCVENTPEHPTDTPCGVCASCVELSRGGPGSLDVVEIDAASHGGVDDARELRERATFAPARDRFKIFILDEAHMVTPQGFNALLKIVEEPPPHVKFVFATTEPDKVIGTIRSRTHHYPFRLVPPDVLIDYLGQLCTAEGVTVGGGVLPLVVRAGAGSVRDALSVLDQLVAGSGPDGIDYESAVALLGFTHVSLLDDLVGAVTVGDGASAFRVVERVISTGHEPRRFVEDLLERIRDLIVISASGDAAGAVFRELPADQLAAMRLQAGHLGAAELSRAADLVNDALREMTGATSPRLHLELLVARLLLPSADDDVAGFGARLDRLERGGWATGVSTGAAAPRDAEAGATDEPTVTAAGAVSAAGGRGAAAVRAALGNASTGARAQTGPTSAPSRPAAQETSAVAQAGARDGNAAVPVAPAAPAAPAVPGAVVPGAAVRDEAVSATAAPDTAATRTVAPVTEVPVTEAPNTAAPATAATEAVAPMTGAVEPTVPATAASVTGAAEPAASAPSTRTRSAAAPTTPSPTTPDSTNAAPPDDVAWPEVAQPAVAQPAVAQQVVAQPAVGEPAAAARPAVADPAPTPESALAPEPTASSEVEPQATPATGSAEPSAAPVPAGLDPVGTEPSEPRSDGRSGAETEMLRRRWPEVLETLKQIKRVSWILVSQNAQVADLDATTLRLAFTGAGVATAFRNGPHAAAIQQAVRETLGFDVRVEGVLDEHAGTAAGRPRATAAPTDAEARAGGSAAPTSKTAAPAGARGAARQAAADPAPSGAALSGTPAPSRGVPPHGEDHPDPGPGSRGDPGPAS
ncbi:DNA polymerase III subunit gamma and tau [Cellulomonas sp. P24]|uniref:DNA polymerase III subunit gamma and tau n=1 Tax=Cellulomonas sp. P24 TaxID=2885206 RepID=UPI00216B60A8|nr:DNA polymerase III subunit gamma and tau [Cellulomonas sp. P24]MCR6492446.1 DNA polymerase III subunit gamma and tau [Cellulomonas sp. P24]